MSAQPIVEAAGIHGFFLFGAQTPDASLDAAVQARLSDYLANRQMLSRARAAGRGSVGATRRVRAMTLTELTTGGTDDG